MSTVLLPIATGDAEVGEPVVVAVPARRHDIDEQQQVLHQSLLVQRAEGEAAAVARERPRVPE